MGHDIAMMRCFALLGPILRAFREGDIGVVGLLAILALLVIASYVWNHFRSGLW